MLHYLLIFILWTTTVYADTSENDKVVVGKIENLACPSDYYELTRSDETLPVKILADLRAGDVISLKAGKLKSQKNFCKNETPILSLNLNGQPIKDLEYHELPYTVPDGTAIATVSSNFFKNLSLWLTDQHDGQLKILASLVGKTHSPTAPFIGVLKGDDQKLSAGERKLFIAWQFGKPPFTVTLKGNEQEQIYPNLSQRHLQEQMTLTAGTYHLVIKDAKRQTAKYQFTVVDTQPRPPSSHKLSNLSDETMRLLVQTLCLAVQDNGVWRFEAVQQMGQLPENDVPAQITQDALLHGAKVSTVYLKEGDCVDNAH
ncbi:MAG: hypothetical protein BWK79_16405 [Beggiatoa sp. IS2]|nr:MAG: hypothetical protein BWK79_16405 [Beggiatoa sp. IS2]